MADDSSSLPPPTTASEGAPVPAGLSRNVVTELVGTLIVMLAGPGLIVLSDGKATDLAVALSFGAGLAIAIGVIGAVANPAFTLALLFVREISLRDAVGDWAGQFAGGIVGAAAIWGINDQTRSSIGSNGWDRSGFSELGSVIAAELVFTIIVVIVLLSAVSQGLSKASIAGFTGLAYAIGHLVLLGIDGGGMNPARSLGSAVFSDTDPNALGQVAVFVIVPMLAAVAAVFVWLLIDDAEVDDTIFDETFLDDMQNAATGDPD